jgi:hypothetical protein
MRMLSIQQPFAQLLVRGIKRFELRPWGTDYRGRIAIYASAARGSQARSEVSTISERAVSLDDQRGTVTAVKALHKPRRQALLQVCDHPGCYRLTSVKGCLFSTSPVLVLKIHRESGVM